MVQTSERKEIKWNPKSFNMQDIVDNFTNIYDDMAANASEITALAQRQTWTITKMFDTPGKHIILDSRKHIRCKLINAFAVLGDNAEEEAKIKYLKDTCTFTDTENAGKARAIRFPVLNSIHWKDPVEVDQTGYRRIIYHFTFESVEEKEQPAS